MRDKYCLYKAVCLAHLCKVYKERQILLFDLEWTELDCGAKLNVQVMMCMMHVVEMLTLCLLAKGDERYQRGHHQSMCQLLR